MGIIWSRTTFIRNSFLIYNYIPFRHLISSILRIPLPISKISLADENEANSSPPQSTNIKTETLAYQLFQYRNKLRDKENNDPIEMMIQKMVLTKTIKEENRKRRTIGLLIRILFIRLYNYLRKFIPDDKIGCAEDKNDESQYDTDEPETDSDDENQIEESQQSNIEDSNAESDVDIQIVDSHIDLENEQFESELKAALEYIEKNNIENELGNIADYDFEEEWTKI